MIPPVANRFVAGETPAEALDRAIELNEQGLGAIINLLGEHYTDRSTVADDTGEYLDLVRDISREGLDACISVKPTQLGLDLGESLFHEQLEQVVTTAKAADVFVWMDMEGTGTTEPSVAAFETVAEEYPRGVGLCLQANLRRTGEDIERLADVPGKIRLVKGAYREPPDVAYQSAARVNEAYRAHLESLFRTREWGIAVASHDPEMIEHAKQLHAVHGGQLEFQMLMGVRHDAQLELAAEYAVYQYIPYGSRWVSYFTRRLLERSENVKFAIRALAGR